MSNKPTYEELQQRVNALESSERECKRALEALRGKEELLKLASDNLLRAKNEWEKTFDAMSEIVTLMDDDLRIIKANKAAHDFFTMTPGELKGKHCYELFRGDTTPCLDCPVVKTIHDGKSHCTHKIKHAKLGKIFHVTSASVFDDHGALQYLVHVAKDITAMQTLEEDLYQAHKMEAMGTLAGGVAHDFNNILVAILGFAELAHNSIPDSNPALQYISQVLKAGDRAKDLVKQILTFSRKETMQKAPLFPSVIVKEVLKLIRASLPSTIQIKQYINSASGTILADPIQLHQVMVNLCTNAFQAMHDEKGVLEIRLTREILKEGEITEEGVNPGPYIMLSVSDTGSGMDSETKKRIFEPYFTTKERGKGTGMGMALAHGIVKSHGGMITVASKVGKGSIFKVYFPAIEKDAISEQLEEKIDLLPNGRNESILVVDDEEVIVEIQKSMLEQLGYRVVAKTDSLDALREFQADPDAFDLLITDQTMPLLTGSELSAQLLQIKPDLAIILCTGYSTMVSEEKAKEIGVSKFIMKPVAKDDLATSVREVLDTRQEAVSYYPN